MIRYFWNNVSMIHTLARDGEIVHVVYRGGGTWVWYPTGVSDDLRDRWSREYSDQREALADAEAWLTEDKTMLRAV